MKDSEFLPGHDLNHLALVVDEGTRESIKETLEQAGTTVEGRDTDPTCVYFDDPDGHRIQILYRGVPRFHQQRRAKGGRGVVRHSLAALVCRREMGEEFAGGAVHGFDGVAMA